MSIRITPFISGPLENNTYLVYDDSSRISLIIDPSFDINPLTTFIDREDLFVKYLLITHAHFDHIAGVNRLISYLPDRPLIGLHPKDLTLWMHRGEAMQYGFNINPLPNPDHFFKDEETLNLEGYQMIVHHTSGHTPGHVVFSIPAVKAIFCGDLIFANGIGRTDLTGGDQVELIKSIQQKILIYPDDTRLFTGHGSETTVGIEKRSNPYLK